MNREVNNDEITKPSKVIPSSFWILTIWLPPNSAVKVTIVANEAIAAAMLDKNVATAFTISAKWLGKSFDIYRNCKSSAKPDYQISELVCLTTLQCVTILDDMDCVKLQQSSEKFAL